MIKRINYNDDGSIDEIVAGESFIHIEQMDDCSYFLSIDGERFWIFSELDGNSEFCVKLEHEK